MVLACGSDAMLFHAPCCGMPVVECVSWKLINDLLDKYSMKRIHTGHVASPSLSIQVQGVKTL